MIGARWYWLFCTLCSSKATIQISPPAKNGCKICAVTFVETERTTRRCCWGYFCAGETLSWVYCPHAEMIKPEKERLLLLYHFSVFDWTEATVLLFLVPHIPHIKTLFHKNVVCTCRLSLNHFIHWLPLQKLPGCLRTRFTCPFFSACCISIKLLQLLRLFLVLHS